MPIKRATKGKVYRLKLRLVLCACGCGGTLPKVHVKKHLRVIYSSGYPRFIKGHSHRGIHLKEFL